MMRSRVDELVIVDDDPGVATLARRVCEAAGFFVSVAHELSSGVNLLSLPPSILIVDMNLGDESGAELIRRASALEPAPGIIAISGGGMPAFRDAIEAGADQFLEKPFPMSVLRDAVDQLRNERRLAASLARWVETPRMASGPRGILGRIAPSG